MSVVSMMVGATTPAGATFACKVDGGGPVRVAVADNAGMVGPVFTSSQAVDAQGVAKVSITGLEPATRFWWRVEDNGILDAAKTGQFRTHPLVGLPASLTVAAASCAGLSPLFPGVAGGEPDPNRVSNHPVFDTIRARALAEDWLLFANLGDWGYPDYTDATVDTLANRRAYIDANLGQPNQAGTFAQVPTTYQPDDHDHLTNNLRGPAPNLAQVYRERIPHYPLPDAAAIYHSVTIGRVLFIASDVRSDGSPNSDPDGPSKTMLGSAQKQWMDSLLAASDAKLVVWLMPQQWLGTTSDSWASFATEQAELVTMFGDHGYSGRVRILSGDYHGVALDTGVNSPGGIPVLQCASLDSSPGAGGGGTYNLGSTDGRNQYGTLQVIDIGSSITVRLTGWRGTEQLVTHQSGFTVSTASVIATGALLRTLTGSHVPLIEARVVTGHPTGRDPDGTDIKVQDGKVTYDGTAEIRGALNLQTPGVDEVHGRSSFPRLVTDQLAPYGAELFVSYGLDLGGAQPLRTPLGYFRMDQPEQDDAPYGGIALSGKDRMAGIVRATLLSPRSYQADTTIGLVAQDLVQDVYPNAVIAWDDDSDQAELGRVLVVDESRYEALKDLADSAGKIVYWDDEGVLRFETAPDETVPLWEVHSGRDGVLIQPSRRISIADTHNAIILIGQGADDQPAVRAVVFDNNPASPTYFFGPFGQAPRKHESPLVNNIDQANAAAIAMLRRSLGASYEVDFTAVTNPTLRPFHPVRVTTRDGNRDVVVMQRVTIPLSPRPMSGAARAAIFASIGSLS